MSMEMTRIFALAVMVMACAGCAGSMEARGMQAQGVQEGPVQPAANAPGTFADNQPLSEQSAAYRVAAALIAAEEAEDGGDVPALGRAALSLEMLGAKPLAEEDRQRLSLWRGQTSQPSPLMRGRALGPAYRSGRLAAGAATLIEQTFLGGKNANVVVRVVTGQPLELRVSDNAQRRVCESGARVIQCRWTPLYTQRHRIEIVNKSSDASDYYIVLD